jgi:hypothetical protein
LPEWYTPEPEAPAAQEDSSYWRDTGANAATAAGRIPGAIIGAPYTIRHAVDWLYAQGINGVGALVGHNPNLTGADVDQYTGTKWFPTSEGVDRRVFAAAGKQPYEPTTDAGRIGQAAITAAGAGAIDPVALSGAVRESPTVLAGLWRVLSNAGKTGLSGAAASGTEQVFPDSPGLGATAALLTHGGTSAAEAVLRGGSRVAADTVRQIVAPTRQGQREAARTLSGVDNSLPGVAQPTDAELNTGVGNVRAATGSIGPGLEPWQAGTAVREGLQSRVDALTQARATATDPIRAARDASTAPVNMTPVAQLIANKLTTAAGPQKDAIVGAVSDLHGPANAFRLQADQLAASRQAINTRINAATRAGDNASAAHLLDIRNALDAQVNAAVPEAGQYNQTFADMSRPLDPSEYGPVAKVLDRDQFNSRYTFPDERVPDLFLRSPATRSDLNQLIDAHGGDKAAALGALEQHLAGKVQGAINPDGTLDQGAFAKAMAPYQKSLGGNVSFWFPQLADKFKNATAAQNTLDTLSTQRALASSISGGALRDNTGTITGQSFGSWFGANKDAIARTQSPAAVMRLQQIGNALKAPQGDLADAIKSEALPAAIGTAFAGSEGGVLGLIAGKITHSAFAGVDQKRLAAFSGAIEKATLDPDYAAALTSKMGRTGGGISPARALVRAIYSTPIAVNAAKVQTAPQGQ